MKKNVSWNLNTFHSSYYFFPLNFESLSQEVISYTAFSQFFRIWPHTSINTIMFSITFTSSGLSFSCCDYFSFLLEFFLFLPQIISLSYTHLQLIKTIVSVGGWRHLSNWFWFFKATIFYNCYKHKL